VVKVVVPLPEKGHKLNNFGNKYGCHGAFIWGGARKFAYKVALDVRTVFTDRPRIFRIKVFF
jgi:hypothetical protein